MADTDFDYGGEVAETVSKVKNPEVGDRNARLYGLIRLGTFCETFHNGGKTEVKAAAPEAIAIFHLLGRMTRWMTATQCSLTRHSLSRKVLSLSCTRPSSLLWVVCPSTKALVL